MTTEWVVREIHGPSSFIIADGFETEEQAIQWAEDTLGHEPHTEPPHGAMEATYVHSVYHETTPLEQDIRDMIDGLNSDRQEFVERSENQYNQMMADNLKIIINELEAMVDE